MTSPNSAIQGWTLTSLLISMIILSLVMLTAGRLFKVALDTNQDLVKTDEKISLMTIISQLVDCDQSVTPRPNACDTNPADIELKDKNGKVVVKRNLTTNMDQYSKIGSYRIRASCTACSICTNGRQVLIQISHENDSQWKSLYGNIPFYCQVPL